MNISENIKNVIHEWGNTYKINNISADVYQRQLKLVPNQSLDFDSMVKYGNDLICKICVFMNINITLTSKGKS